MIELGCKVRSTKSGQYLIGVLYGIEDFFGTVVRFSSSGEVALVETADGRMIRIHKDNLESDDTLNCPPTTYKYFDAGALVCTRPEAVDSEEGCRHFEGIVIRRVVYNESVSHGRCLCDEVIVRDSSGKEIEFSSSDLKEIL